MPTITTHFLSLHPIDLKDAKPVKVDTSKGGNDVNTYTEALIDDILEHESKRSFKFARATTEVHLLITAIIGKKDHVNAPQTIAERLLAQEKQSQQRVIQMGIKLLKGCLLQVHFTKNARSYFLLAKVDYHAILDDTDLKKRIGLPFNKRIIKACLVPLDASNAFVEATVYDNGSGITEYWWKDFLELTEDKSDAFNTKTAFDAVDALLTKALKKISKPDYFLLRNNVIGYFRTQTSFDYTAMTNSVFGSYKPESSDVDMADIKMKLAKLPTAKKFDTKFNIEPSAIKARTRITLKLAENLDLLIKNGVPDLDKIVTAFDERGERGIRIRTEEGFEHFRQAIKIPLKS